MADESPEDKDVDGLITDLQSVLDRLKAAQGKDVKDETSEEDKEAPSKRPRSETANERVARVRSHFRRLRAQQ